jgi:hypothetical protein
MTVMKMAMQRRPRWRQGVSVLITAYLTLSSLGFLVMTVSTVPGGSMVLGSGVSPGVELTGTFHYRYDNAAKGKTVDIPVTATEEAYEPGRVIVDASGRDEIDGADYTAFGDGRGWATLPSGVHLRQEANPSDQLQALRTGDRLTLGIDSPVGWRGRLLVALPSVLIWVGLWIALVTFGLLLRSIIDGRPFDPDNPRRLLTLGGALAAALFADSWLRVWIVRGMLHVLNQHGHRIPLQADNPGINAGPVCVVVAVLCLAAAFRIGARMAADTDGLV